ncbi:MAG: PIN domain-containing protein [Anaerolineales bacterium]|nr:PIN domain-containing protein [Anaerolineales bacterium]
MDTKDQIRTALEAEAVLGILSLVESSKISLLLSEVLLFEINRNPNQIRREYALEVASKAKDFVDMSARIEKRSRELVGQGIRFFDAVHLASAEEGRADYFCTCDDVLLKKAGKVTGLKVQVVSPPELVKEL